MKIRTDFVTDVCGSSFILNRQLELTERQREAVLRFFMDRLSGGSILSGKKSAVYFREEERRNEGYLEKEQEKGGVHFKQTQEAAEEGKEDAHGNFNGEERVWRGEADLGEKEYVLAELYCRLWNVVEKAGSDDFDPQYKAEERE